MYNWRKMNADERARVLKERKVYKRPWHAPPHFEYEGLKKFIITAACFEHGPVIGKSAQRMSECEAGLLSICDEIGVQTFAWCVLPNHYHLLIQTDQIKKFLYRLGKFHGASSFRWNGEDNARGRKVWYRCVEREMQSQRHFLASMNYIHHNPVKHGYVDDWKDWAHSSAAEYLERIGRERALEIWREYPVLDYGREWDPD